MKIIKLLVIVVVLGLLLITAVAYNRYNDLSYLPMTISADRVWYKTSVYLKLIDVKISLNIKDFLQQATNNDEAFKSLIAKLGNGDVGGLEGAVHQGVGSNSKEKLVGYLNGAIQYWGRRNNKQVERKFSYSNEKVYIVDGELKTQKVKIVIRFALDESDNTYKYVPFGMDNFEKKIIGLWAKQYSQDQEKLFPFHGER